MLKVINLLEVINYPMSTVLCSKIVHSSTLQLEPKLNVDGTPASARKLTRYAQFIQDNYSSTRKALPLMSHKEIMEVLRGKYHAQQAEASQEF